MAERLARVPDQTDLEPVRAGAGIREQHVAEAVAAEHAAGVDEDVLIAVAVEVGDGDGAGLLQVADAGVGGDVGESASAAVAVQHLRHQALVARVGGADVEIEKAVAVEVADAEAAAEQHALRAPAPPVTSSKRPPPRPR